MALLKEPEFGDPGKTQATRMASRRGVSQPEDRHRRYMPSNEDPFLMSKDFLEVHNEEPDTVVFKWDRKAYPIKSGESAFVPFPALVMALGDPRSVDQEATRFNDGDEHGLIPTRYEELQKLFARYGVRNENIDDETAGARQKAVTAGDQVPLHPGPISLVGKAPKVKCFTMAGKQIDFPAHIPDMLPIGVPNVEGPAGPVTDARASMDRMMSENAEMRSRVAALEDVLNERLGGAGGTQP